MPIEQVWALVVALVGIIVLVIIDDFRKLLALKSANEEISVLRKQLYIEMRKNEKSVPELNTINSEEIKETKQQTKKPDMTGVYRRKY